MKTFVKIFLVVVVLIVIAASVFAAPSTQPTTTKKDTVHHLTVSPTSYKDLLVLHADKSYFGATVEVHDVTGALVSTGTLNKRKMIIDFYDTPYGVYTICVIKDNKRTEFKHTKIQTSVVLN
jgi:hypothetical protein